MKKTLLVLSVIFLTVSCMNKRYYCECDHVDLVHGEKSETLDFDAHNKSTAKEHCESGMGVHYVDFECELR